MLVLKNLKKTYITKASQQVALNNINISFRSEEFVSILGPSGSGKTTLLNVIGGLDKYDSGDLIINGVSTKKYTSVNWDSYRNNHIGFVFQNYNLINHISVYKNVELALTLSNKKNKRKKVLEVLNQVGLTNQIYKNPNELSGGQMQRVAIARAIVNNPDIILADEPTGALDSKTSIQIMNTLKKLSKDKLVIMVTHNEELAKKYSDRIIKINDGKIVSDSCEFNNVDNSNKLRLKKTKMNYRTALNLALNNIKTKKSRTILTSIASSIGIIGIALILSISNGFNKQIDSYEKNTLSSFPIMISKVITSFENADTKEEYPKSNKLYVYDEKNSNMIHVNKITSDYMKYIENIDKTNLSIISYDRMNNFNILYKLNSEYKSSTSSYLSFAEIPTSMDNSNFLEKNYDLLKGYFPKSYDEVVLMVSDKNEVDKKLLDYIGVDANFTINDILDKEFMIVNNDDYYQNINGAYIRKNPSEDMYNNHNNIKIKIVGIIRPKKDNDLATIIDAFSMSKSKIAYDGELLQKIIEKNKDSDIVKSQENKDTVIFMGNASFEEAGLLKEEALTFLNKNDIAKSINLYPSSFNGKDSVIDYLDKYNKNKKDVDKVLYNDYAKTISKLSSGIMDAITIVLVAFSSISLIVSSVMIGIITYISVLERTKEIGILRSIGARKKDITRVFNAEVLITGVLSGLIGILVTKILLIPINSILYKLTDLKSIGILSIKHSLVLIFVSTLLTLIGGYIPAKMASKMDPAKALRSE